MEPDEKYIILWFFGHFWAQSEHLFAVLLAKLLDAAVQAVGT